MSIENWKAAGPTEVIPHLMKLVRAARGRQHRMSPDCRTAGQQELLGSVVMVGVQEMGGQLTVAFLSAKL